MITDFEKRYKREALKRPSEKTTAKIKQINQELLKKIGKKGNRLVSLKHYEELLTTDKRKLELKISRKKIIGTYCYFVPDELILAADALPVRLCSGHSESISIAEEVIPRDICPLVKSAMGFAILGNDYFDHCDVIALPATCDAKTKMGEYLSDYKPVWMMNIPKIKDYQTVKKRWIEEIQTIKGKMEAVTGNKITKEKLKQAIQMLQKRSALYRRLFEIRKEHPAILSHQEMLMVIQATFFDDVPRWIEKTELLIKEIEGKITKEDYKTVGKKIMITGAPIIWPNYKILNIIEELGATVVVDDMCVGHQRLWDYPEPDEWTMDGMLDAVSARYLFPTVCPCFTTSYDRIDKVLNLAQESKVDGIIYHDLRLCQLFDMEKDQVHKAVKGKDIPMLTLHTDYGQEDVEQLRTRIEAFLEMII